MTESQHAGETAQIPNKNKAMRNKPGATGSAPAKKPPTGEAHDEATIEEFGREGMGVSAKE